MKFSVLNNILAAIFLAATSVVLFFFLKDTAFRNPDSHYSQNQQASMHPGKPVTQVFTATENNLSKIKIPLKDLEGELDEKMRYELLDENCQNFVAENEYGFVTFLFDKSPNFRFDPISDSKNKKYCLRLTYFASEKRKGEIPILKASSDDCFADSSYYNAKNGRTYDGRSLAIEPSYASPEVSENIKTLINRLSQYKPGWLKGGWLVLILLSSIFIFILLMTALILI